MAFQDFIEEAFVRRCAFEEQGNPGPILVAAGLYKDGEQVFLPADPGLDLADPSRHGLLRGFRDERVVRRQNLTRSAGESRLPSDGFPDHRLWSEPLTTRP